MDKTEIKIKAKKKISTGSIVIAGMSASLLAILSQLSIPMPSGIPVTLQTFAVAFIGIVLLSKLGIVSVGVYILVGAVGVPVFANLNAGMAAITGKTGGFLWGFLFLVMFCGAGSKIKNKWAGIAVGLAGLVPCHMLGILQFMILTNISLKDSFIFVSFPYLPKDILSVIIAYVVGWQVRKLLLRASVLTQ